MSCPTDGAILNGLQSLRYSPQDPKLPATDGVLGALEVVHLQAQVPDQVEVNEGHWGDPQLLGGQHGEWPPLDGEDVLLHVRGVVLTGSGENLARFFTF